MSLQGWIWYLRVCSYKVMLHQGLQVEHHWQFGEIVQFAEEVGGVFDVGGKFGVQ